MTETMPIAWFFRMATRSPYVDINTLIKPPRQIFTGGGWDNTDKLIPRGHAETDRLVAARLEQEGRRDQEA